MYFTKVELHNFGIYKGTHEMCLTNQIGNRNITLVGGLNGRGKTTFHDSILIALYGKQALKYIQEKARSYDKLLLDHINKHATDKETYTGLELHFERRSELLLTVHYQYQFSWRRCRGNFPRSKGRLCFLKWLSLQLRQPCSKLCFDRNGPG